MDPTRPTTEHADPQAPAPPDASEGPYGTTLPDQPVAVPMTNHDNTTPAAEDELVPMPAWVEQQRREAAQDEAHHAQPPAEPASAGGQPADGDPAGADPADSEPTDSAPAAQSASTEDDEPTGQAPDTPALPELDPLPAPDQTRQIALINQKGGVGKTTTTVNLGAALAASGLRVLMIDLDPQAHLTLSLGIDPEELDLSIYDLLADDTVSAAQVVRIVDGCDRLGVLPADTNLAGIESELAEQVKTGLAQTLLRNKCADLMAQFDYVLIDCPPSLGLLTINGLTCGKEIIVPMQAHFLALQGMGKLFETINMIRQGINPQLHVSGVVLCMHEANTILASDVVADVEAFFEQAKGTALPWSDAVVYQPPIRRNIKLAEAPSFGQSVLTYAHDSNGAKDYAALAKSVATAITS